MNDYHVTAWNHVDDDGNPIIEIDQEMTRAEYLECVAGKYAAISCSLLRPISREAIERAFAKTIFIAAAVVVALSGCVPTSWDGLRQTLSGQISADFVAAGCPPEGTNAREHLAFIQCAEPVEWAAMMRMDPAALPRYEQYAYERRELTREAVAGQISDAEFHTRMAASGQAWRHAWDGMHSQMAGGERFFYVK